MSETSMQALSAFSGYKLAARGGIQIKVGDSQFIPYLLRLYDRMLYSL